VEVTLGPIEAIPVGEGRNYAVGKEQIAVFRTRAGEVFATQASCPHRGGRLADGLLGSRTLICPLHSLKFDLATGKAKDGECALRVYPARLGQAGQVVVDIRE